MAVRTCNEAGQLQSSSPKTWHDNVDEKDPRHKEGLFSRLGNLPEWTVRGKHMEGTTLNWAIGFIASCGFLMFGYVACPDAAFITRSRC